MGHPIIKCYLYGMEATLLTPDTSGDEIVECGGCINRYKIRATALKFYLEREDKEILNEDDKEKLSRFVYNHTVIISPDVIKKVTGKESVHYR